MQYLWPQYNFDIFRKDRGHGEHNCQPLREAVAKKTSTADNVEAMKMMATSLRAQWDQISKKVPFKKSFRHLKNCKNMNFCTFKNTKNQILALKNV